HLETSIDSRWEGVVLPADSDRRRHLRVDLPLIAEIDAGRPPPNRGWPLGPFGALRIEERRHHLRGALKWKPEQEVGELVEVVRRGSSAERRDTAVEGEHRHGRFEIGRAHV